MKNRRSIMTKTMFRETLFELLKTTPINRISVKELCEKADLNRSTFYLHYDTIDDFIREFEEEMVDSRLKTLGTVGKEVDTVPYFEKILRSIKEDPQTYRNLMCDRYVKDYYITAVTRAFPFLLDQKGGLFEDEYAGYYIVSGSIAVVEKWINDGCRMPVRQLAELLYRLDHGNTFYNPL